MSKHIFHFAAIVLLLAGGAPAAAQVAEDPPAVTENRDESWYYQQPTSYRPDPRALIHQKAQVRAHQRQARLAAMSWYGMSNSRPTASPTPFTSLYSPVWQVSGGRPFAWHTANQPNYVVLIR